MADVVVTVPKNFSFDGKRGLAAWIAEGELPGEPWSGMEWDFYLGGSPPNIEPGERVYIVCENKLRGYSPLIRIEYYEGRTYSLVRRGNAVAVTIDRPITGFRGFRYRDWDYSEERPFPDWQQP
jgi:hypothetical protein